MMILGPPILLFSDFCCCRPPCRSGTNQQMPVHRYWVRESRIPGCYTWVMYRICFRVRLWFLNHDLLRMDTLLHFLLQHPQTWLTRLKMCLLVQNHQICTHTIHI
jgi:hypothetical protein